MTTPSPSTTNALYHGTEYRNNGNSEVLGCIPDSVRRVLDIGCGAGDNARILQARGCEVWGVTLSEREAESSRPFCHSVLVSNIEHEDLAAPLGSFDAIICSHVMEHLVRPDLALVRLQKHLAPDGRIVIAVPNMANWRIRMRLLRGDWSRQKTGPFDRTHLQFWSHRTAPDMATGTGLVVQECRCVPTAVPIPLIRKLLPNSLKQFLDARVGGIWPNLFGWQVVLILQRSPSAQATESSAD